MNNKRKILILGAISSMLASSLISINKVQASENDNDSNYIVVENNIGEINQTSSLNPEHNKILDKMNQDRKYSLLKEECVNTINRYSGIYNIKSDIVIKIVSDYTSNFESIDFIYNKSISDSENHDTFDYEILFLVRDIKYNPGNYGYSYSDVQSENYNENINEGTIRDFVEESSTIIGLNPTMSLSIACAESGYFEAGIATNNNNPFALRSTAEFNTYENIYQGILEGEINLKRGYIDNGLTTYETIAPKYCGSSSWADLVYGVQNELNNGKTLYDEDTNELTLK